MNIIGASDGIPAGAVQGIIVVGLLVVILGLGVALYMSLIKDTTDDLDRPISDPAMRKLMQRVIRERTEDPNRQS